MKKIKTDFLIVGSGLYGCVIAERLANVLKKKVTIIEKRNHIGGNCYSEIDEQTGIEFHKYGTHIFHTSKKNVWYYLKKFTSLNKDLQTYWLTFGLNFGYNFKGERLIPSIFRK